MCISVIFDQIKVLSMVYHLTSQNKLLEEIWKFSYNGFYGWALEGLPSADKITNARVWLVGCFEFNGPLKQ